MPQWPFEFADRSTILALVSEYTRSAKPTRTTSAGTDTVSRQPWLDLVQLMRTRLVRTSGS